MGWEEVPGESGRGVLTVLPVRVEVVRRGGSAAVRPVGRHRRRLGRRRRRRRHRRPQQHEHAVGRLAQRPGVDGGVDGGVGGVGRRRRPDGVRVRDRAARPVRDAQQHQHRTGSLQTGTSPCSTLWKRWEAILYVNPGLASSHSRDKNRSNFFKIASNPPRFEDFMAS